MKVKIESDVFDITQRIKEIDDGYFIMFNVNSKKFEIHNKNTKNGYCLTVPYCQLDNRTIELIHKTHIKNYDKIVKSLDEDNEKLNNKQIEKLKEINDYKVREILKYSKVTTKPVDKVFKSTWL